MTVKQPLSLVRFISGIPVASDGTINLNSMDSDGSFISDLYTPSFSISVLARETLNLLDSDIIIPTSTDVDRGTITYKILNSDLASYAPDVYLLVRMVVLESFALIYHINEDRSKLRYVSKRDIVRVKGNISYLTDYMGTESKYHVFIESLRDMYISLGYMEHQIDGIMNNRGVR
jgi:hypothetical protein